MLLCTVQPTPVSSPFSGLSVDVMVIQTREAMHHRDSTDPKVAAAGIYVCTGRKWSAARGATAIGGMTKAQGLCWDNGNRGIRPELPTNCQLGR